MCIYFTENYSQPQLKPFYSVEDDAPWQSMVSDKGESQEETVHFWCLSVSFFLQDCQEEFSNKVWGERGKLILSLWLLFSHKQTLSFATSLSQTRFNLYKTLDNCGGNFSLPVYEIIKGSLHLPVCKGLSLGMLQSIIQTIHSKAKIDAEAWQCLVTRLYSMAVWL